MEKVIDQAYKEIVAEISEMDWEHLSVAEMEAAAHAYYYFSVQFRESLLAARALFADDAKLAQLEREECDTSNLSPWSGVALPGEKMNHDEFMRRTLQLDAVSPELEAFCRSAGETYLAETRALTPMARALSISSYEDGGLEAVFRGMLRFQHWDSDLLRAFEHFLVEHVRFDSNPDAGHGALSRHLQPDERVLPLWEAFKTLFLSCVPRLASVPVLASVDA